MEREGATNELLEQANTIGAPPDNAQQQPVNTGENPPGSLERFLGSFGSPTRWAGR